MDLICDMFSWRRLDVQFVKNIPLEMVIGQQMKEEGHDQNYWWFLHLTFHLFAT